MKHRSPKRPSWKRLRDSRRMIKQLKREGWFWVQTNGDHYQFRHPDKPGKASVPHPNKDIPISTLRNIYRQTGWEWN